MGNKTVISWLFWWNGQNYCLRYHRQLIVVLGRWPGVIVHQAIQGTLCRAGLGGSVGCAVRLETRRSRVQPPPASLGGSVGCAVRLETRRSRVQPRRGRQHSFAEIDHEIFSTVSLSLPLIQEGQLSVSGERMCTILVNRLED